MRVISRAIVIGNGVAFAQNQCIGLLRALGRNTLYRVNRPINDKLRWLPYNVHKQLDGAVEWIRGKPAKKLMPFPAEPREADARYIAKAAHPTFEMDGPILVVASGHDTITIASSIKNLVPDNVFLVQVLTVGALHQADSDALRSAASAWHDEMALLPKPLLVVSVGGPTRHCRYGADLAMQLTASLKSVLPTCGSIRISFSRRTPKIVSEIILTEFSNHPRVYIWNGQDPNPHMGHLALADAFVITADSVSMLSEACSTGKPVYVIGAERCTWKFSHFIRTLHSRAAVRPFTGTENICEKWEYVPLDDTEKAAGEVIKAVAERGWRLLPYSTKDPNQLPTEYCEGGDGIRKVPLAKNLANLVVEVSLNSTDKAGLESHRVDERYEKNDLAKNLASLVQESYEVSNKESKPKTRVEIKRFLEMRIKKKVKAQYRNGKYHDLMMKVIADPSTLKDAYDCIRLTSNVDLALDGDDLPFLAIAEELADGNFDVGAHTYSMRSKGPKFKKEELVLPELKLRVVQEAIRIVLEVVYRPHFSRISHSLRSNRDHWSALKYICKEIPDPDWWFTLPMNKNLDDCILQKLLSSMEDKIEDPVLCDIIKDMFKARVLNVEFGSFPKGHGLPQEGVLSPILINIYLDLFDREVYRMSMHYETSHTLGFEEQKLHSKLRGWFRKQISGSSLQQRDSGMDSGVRVHCCRFMDEVFFAFSGSKEVALAFKSEIEGFLKNSLYLEVDDKSDILASNDPRGVKFLGTLVRRHVKETPALRAVRKLKDKVKIFAEQKQESWDAGALRIGKKWLAHGLKKVKESEIKQLADSSSILHKISYYRRSGMKIDHWYKVLLKIWMQHVNAKSVGNEEKMLTKLVVEPTLPQELRDAYFEFQKRAKEYVDSETSSTLALLTGSSSSPEPLFTTETIVPLNVLMKRLHRYGLTNREGYGRPCYVLILLDHDQIIDWFTGILHRWLRWYRGCNNFNEVKHLICDQVRMSCIRTLAVKYRIHESDIEKKFDSELSRIPSTEDIELEEAITELIPPEYNFDGALMYGIQYSGLCSLSLARMVSESRPCYCFVIGCSASVSCVYTLHVMERQKFPAWKTGFSSCIHPSLHRRRIGLCKKHVKDLFLGNISLQSIGFGTWR